MRFGCYEVEAKAIVQEEVRNPTKEALNSFEDAVISL